MKRFFKIISRDECCAKFWTEGNIYSFEKGGLETDNSMPWHTSGMPPYYWDGRVEYEEVFPTIRIFKCEEVVDDSISWFFKIGRVYEYDVEAKKLYCERNEGLGLDSDDRNFYKNHHSEDEFFEMHGRRSGLTDVTNSNNIFLRCISEGLSDIFKKDFIYEYKINEETLFDGNSKHKGSLLNILETLSSSMEVVFKIINPFKEEEEIKEIDETEEMKNILMKVIEDSLAEQQKRLVDTAIALKQDYEHHKRTMKRKYTEWEVTDIKAKATPETKGLEEKILKELTDIKEHKLCKKLSIKNNAIEIYTEKLVITEPHTMRKYSLGEMLFTIPLEKDKDTFVSNLSTTRQGYGVNMHHPHIFSNEACWGNVDPMIAEYTATREYYALYITVLSFCQTVDIDDVAGWYVSCWDEVDEGGNVIEEGHRPTYDEYDGHGCRHSNGDYEYCCEICDCGLDEDEYLCCEDCGDYFCESHAGWYDELDKVVCNGCFDKYYFNCDGCGNPVDRERDNWYQTTNKGDICDNCYQDKYFTCEYCNGVYNNEDGNHIAVGDTVCNDCFEEHCFECDICGESLQNDEEVGLSNICNGCYEGPEEEEAV